MSTKYVNDEETLFRRMVSVPKKETVLLTNSCQEAHLHKILQKSSNWKIVAENTNFTPDIISDKYGMMGDMMIVDDCGYTKQKGKRLLHINEQSIADRRAYNELVNSGVLDLVPNCRNIVLNSNTNYIPAFQHHSYDRYVAEFQRIVGNHIKQIPTYRSNHPEYKLIFFIYDQSTPYGQLDSCLYSDEYLLNNAVRAELHFPFIDKNLVSIFKDSDVDFVAWHMPYKHFATDKGRCEYPVQLAILEVRNFLNAPLRQYCPSKMISCEK